MRKLVVVLCLLTTCSLRADPLVIPANEAGTAPTAARVDLLVAQASQQGWGGLVGPLRQAFFDAYAHEAGSAGPWYHLYLWSKLLGTTKSDAISRWVRALDGAGGAHANMATRYQLPPGSLATLISPDLQRWALANPTFSEDFFNTLGPLDQPVESLGILQQLYAANPAIFAEYANLAIAITVVFDVPPPPDWPHGQVSTKALPRRFPAPLEAFNYWVRADRTVLGGKLRRLPASELKFVVDTVTPFPELTWAQRTITSSPAEFDKVYGMVKYRLDRLQKGQMDWPAPGYQLETILRDGGICVDQAYFASNVGKARGIPTLLFRGAGLDGRHAWFGYLGPNGWMLDAGRYADQKFVAGLAYDPQTWKDLNDHELLFIMERFRALPLYKLSMIHTAMAIECLENGNRERARDCAREAVRREPRNELAWDTLVRIQLKPRVESKPYTTVEMDDIRSGRFKTDSVDLRAAEGVLREATLALQKYPDLEIKYSRLLVASERARGETSLAAVEEQRIVRKYQANRADLSIQQAAGILKRSIEQDDLANQFKTYQYILTTYGYGAGTDFFDKVVAPFVVHLEQTGQISAALQALDKARQTLRVEKGSQLDLEITGAAQKLRKDG